MIKMELLDTNIIRAVLYGFGYLTAMYYIYSIKITKRSIIDLILSVGIYFLMNISNHFIEIKELVFLVIALGILTINHKIKLYSALMFSFASLFMLTYTYPVAVLSIRVSDAFMDAIINQSRSFIGYLAIIIPSVIFVFFYILGAYTLKKLISVDRDRLKNIYFIFSAMNIVLITIISFLLGYIIKDFGTGFDLKDTYDLMAFSFIGLLLVPVISIYILRRIYLFDIKMEITEMELHKVNDSRMLAYRYSHNLNNIMISINRLAKEGKTTEINDYLKKV